MGRLKTLDEWLDWQESLHAQEIDLGLERVQKVYRKLFPNGVPFQVITVAGTNGKGSTITFIDSIYQQSDFKIGAFTSPHLIKYNERFSVNGKMASDERICQAFDTIEVLRGNTSLTYFEFSTLAALVIFANEKVAIAVLEIGLGGRLDSVNIVDPNVSVITNIAIDHTDYLGDTREVIGLEKAGIMRNDVSCICGDQNPPTSLQNHADNIGALLTFVNQPYLGKISLQGEHQQYNAALAIEVVNQLQPLFPIDQSQLSQGLEKANILARFQIKILNDKTIVLDVAHNEAAIKVLAETLKSEKVPTLAIFSALKDKNIELMINAIEFCIDEWLIVPLSVNRAIRIQDLVEKFSLSSKITTCKGMESAIHQALNTQQHQRVVIFGSFHTVVDAMKILDKY
ncbi:MAG TPA: bifunctional folylpolyglutamate synthase/dihydrofolate synthase [Gammaproteobacteria bacterium]|nr:bifunctional folylpolyglutamate synthase/dihydrofolate synthase [Gammaproteobacteria bacterium]HCW72333.1 bifunctional folylpolyglutamate synthase/dihydrofolate synthase [Gammaproteobacteria bacterium]